MIIALDGPAGAGKSTVASRLADALGMVRLDTGALYRTVGLAASRAEIATDDPALGAFVSGLAVRLVGDSVFLGEEDVSFAIRTPAASAAASRYAAIPAVRAALLDLQRRIGRAQDTIVDGRDIGTVVFPDAEVKLYLTASPEARAERRRAELEAKGLPCDFAQVLAEMIARDHADSTREIAPLKQADDAVLVDSTALDLDAVVAACAAVVEKSRTLK